MAFYQFRRQQLVNADLKDVWEFIATPSNLSKITPDYMGFEILNGDLPEKMYEGMIISYAVKPLLGIKTNWVTEITHIKEHAFFVDEQRVGPYNMWHHQHHIEPFESGTLMKDIISYVPPYSMLGILANSMMIEKKLEEIFDYRKLAVEYEFGK